MLAESARELILAHSSDLHIGGGRLVDESHPLCTVISTARAHSVDLLLLAGDVFDHNRVGIATLDRVARIMDDSRIRIVLLPGNHDCITPESVYRRGGIGEVPGVTVIGLDGETASFPDLELDVWGRAHYDYQNMSPLHDPPGRRARWSVAIAHGHWMRGPADQHRGWLITDDDIEATAADYVALGHWPQAGAAGNGSVPAYYCGSPDLAETINIVRLGEDGVRVTREPLAPVRP
jgi:DNA repair exonuclease SbcCD nuclease subunit